MLSDGDRIRNLLGTYCERVDAGDFAGVGQLFADGVLAGPDGTVFARGAAEVADWYRRGVQLHDGSPGTRHLVVNTVLEEPAADGTVTARSGYLVVQAAPDLPLQPVIAGRYVDRFGRDRDGAWRFVERRFAADLVGDLSRHWHGPTSA